MKKARYIKGRKYLKERARKNDGIMESTIPLVEIVV